MDVVNRLTGACVHIEDCAITLLMDIRLHRQSFGNLKYVADERIVLSS